MEWHAPIVERPSMSTTFSRFSQTMYQSLILLAIPVAGIIRVLMPDIVAVYKRSNFFTGALETPDGSEVSSAAAPAAQGTPAATEE